MIKKYRLKHPTVLVLYDGTNEDEVCEFVLSINWDSDTKSVKLGDYWCPIGVGDRVCRSKGYEQEYHLGVIPAHVGFDELYEEVKS